MEMNRIPDKIWYGHGLWMLSYGRWGLNLGGSMSLKLTEWANKVHATAKSKGWWESPREAEEICMLFVTEIAEASECARSNEPPIHFGRVGDPKLPSYFPERATCVDNYIVDYAQDPTRPIQFKPEGEAIELVDLLVRLGDFFGSKGWDLGAVLVESYPELKPDLTFADVVAHVKTYGERESFSERPLINHFELVERICDAIGASTKTEAHHFSSVFMITIGYMIYRGFDVESAVEMKMAYNEKRPYRHGGKSA